MIVDVILFTVIALSVIISFLIINFLVFQLTSTTKDDTFLSFFAFKIVFRTKMYLVFYTQKMNITELLHEREKMLLDTTNGNCIFRHTFSSVFSFFLISVLFLEQNKKKLKHAFALKIHFLIPNLIKDFSLFSSYLCFVCCNLLHFQSC